MYYIKNDFHLKWFFFCWWFAYLKCIQWGLLLYGAQGWSCDLCRINLNSYSFSMHLHIAADIVDDVFMSNILITEHAISLIFYVEIYARRKFFESWKFHILLCSYLHINHVLVPFSAIQMRTWKRVTHNISVISSCSWTYLPHLRHSAYWECSWCLLGTRHYLILHPLRPS